MLAFYNWPILVQDVRYGLRLFFPWQQDKDAVVAVVTSKSLSLFYSHRSTSIGSPVVHGKSLATTGVIIDIGLLNQNESTDVEEARDAIRVSRDKRCVVKKHSSHVQG